MTERELTQVTHRNHSKCKRELIVNRLDYFTAKVFNDEFFIFSFSVIFLNNFARNKIENKDNNANDIYNEIQYETRRMREQKSEAARPMRKRNLHKYDAIVKEHVKMRRSKNKQVHNFSSSYCRCHSTFFSRSHHFYRVVVCFCCVASNDKVFFLSTRCIFFISFCR